MRVVGRKPRSICKGPGTILSISNLPLSNLDSSHPKLGRCKTMRRSAEYFSGAFACVMILFCLFVLLSGCQTSIPTGLVVPKMNCKATGMTVRIEGGKFSPSAGCIEPDPIPGVPEPPPPPQWIIPPPPSGPVYPNVPPSPPPPSS
jgi:hypothetical protein